MSRVAELIRAELGSREWSGAALAYRMGRTPQYVTDILKGKKGMDAPLAIALEAVLGIPAARFLLADLEDARQGEQAAQALQLVEQGQARVRERAAQRELRGKVARLRREVRLDQLSPQQFQQIASIVDEVASRLGGSDERAP